MAALFPNTVFVQGFPGSMSRHEILKKFGGSNGRIISVDFTNAQGKPKAVFIKYQDAESVPLALKMNGTRLFNHPLHVQEVDERVLCDHVPGEMHDTNKALVELQKVLSSVVASRDKALLTCSTNINKLNQLNERSQTMINGLKKFHEQYKELKEREGREKDSNLLQTITQLNTTIDRCAKLEVENGLLKERMKDAEEYLTSAHCTQVQTEIDVPKTRLMEIDSELKAEREHKDSESKDAEITRRELEDITAQKAQTAESLGMANNTVWRLQEELKIAHRSAETSQSSVQWAKTTLENMSSRVSTLKAYTTQNQTKRQRAEEDLVEEREAKRRLIEERDVIEARCCGKVHEADTYQAKCRQLEEKLRMEMHQRNQAEKSLAEANAKLDRVVVTDRLTAVFLKLDQLVMQAVEELQTPDDPSTSR